MLHTKFQGHRLLGSGEEDFFSDFYHIWAWRPFWSCDQHRLTNFCYPIPRRLHYEIWLQLAQWFQRRRCLKMLTYTHTYIHTRIHTYTHTYIHTYTHIYTYIHEAFLYYQLRRAKKKLLPKERIYIQRRNENFSGELLYRPCPWYPYGKNLKNSSSLEPHGRRPGNLVCSIECSSTTMFVQITTSSHFLGCFWSDPFHTCR